MGSNRNKARIPSRLNFRLMAAKKRFLLCLLIAIVARKSIIVTAWKQCSPEDGGGICPDGNTCCPTGTPGRSSCIPGRARDPDGAKGQCCDAEGATGCPFGYECAVREHTKPTQICKRKEPHTKDRNAKETPRYRLCRLPLSSSPSSDDNYQLQNFPIDGFNAVYYSNMGAISPKDTNAIADEMQKFSNIETVLVIVHGSGRNADDYLCAGMSTAEAISKFGQNTNGNRTKLLEGSNTNDKHGKVLVIAPRFLADIDHEDRNLYQNTLYWWERGNDIPLSHTWRYGADAVNTLPKRGDNRNQTGISSYAVMDRLLEHIVGSKYSKGKTTAVQKSPEQRDEYYFPNLKRIVVAGHSAGGQYVHRWSLLSSSPVIWGDGDDFGDKDSPVPTNETRNVTNHRKVEMRMVVANPRSYCYPDNRRMIRTGTFSNGPFRHLGTNRGSMIDNSVNKNVDSSLDNGDTAISSYSYRFEVPDSHAVDACPTYDQWQWGLEPGGDVLCPYKDNALDLVHNNVTALALRYSKRKVFYLAGQHDTIVQDDRCETYDFQGDHRNERARRYYRALTEYLATLETDRTQSISTRNEETKHNLIHEFHQVSESPHDHTLMFQSAPAREAFYGAGLESNDTSKYESNRKEKLETGVDSESVSRINPRKTVEYSQIQ